MSKLRPAKTKKFRKSYEGILSLIDKAWQSPPSASTNAKTEQELKLEVMLLKAWSETVLEKVRKEEAINALNQLNLRVHSGYDFNSDPDKITLLVGSVLHNHAS